MRIGDGQVLEFQVPYPMHIVDESKWPSLPFTIDGWSLAVQKPIPVFGIFEGKFGIGNESPDLPSSIIQVTSNGSDAGGYPEADSVWPFVECLLTWIRVKARHYWLLHGSAGFGALYRGSSLRQSGDQVGQSNFSTYGQTLIVKPLSREIWETLAYDIPGLSTPPVSDSIYCDAMVSTVGGDEIKAVLELGVACEIEISSLLDDLVAADPQASASQEYKSHLAGRSWRELSFKRKLGAWPQKWGLPVANSFRLSGMPLTWEADVNELYNFRGAVAHSGRLRHGKQAQELVRYLFASNALFEYCREQRRVKSIPTYGVASMQVPASQVLAYTGGRMSGKTSFNFVQLR
jgi:hypothetical protein